MMLVYDENALLARLEPLDRWAKTAFAAACAQRLFPHYERYARSADTLAHAQILADILSTAWDVASGRVVIVQPLQSEAESMVPSEDGDNALESGYAENAAVAVAYAIRTWLSDDPQEAVWAARQVFDVADYAFWLANPNADVNDRSSNNAVMKSDIVQEALSAIDRYLDAVASAPPSWLDLRKRSRRTILGHQISLTHYGPGSAALQNRCGHRCGTVAGHFASV
ncbi:DUF416 family protein [Arthrobacter oryzae]|uniref:DUF416 family protein n=1 Tax=Arthrobacter oryzae TaxID=409290 RepID=UPI0027879297|nr:DUF416 family protein [Arthrobacter oryzae]MDQ0077888.1 uncharacterized protein YjaG (DUF416 family) [Arthrobacter oryzae]